MPPEVDQVRSARGRAARLWLGLALGVLVLAGLFAVAVVVGRTPPFDRWVTDPLFFKRCLVAHVNLALVAWFYSFVAALLFLLPGSGRCGALARNAVWISVAGVALMLLGASLPDARPLLSNYVPTIDHWSFKTGQLLFGAGVLASLVDRRLLPGSAAADAPAPLELPDAARVGLHAVALALVLATLTFTITALRMPTGLETEVYYELLVWGGGHVLQLVCTVAMVTLWMLLLSSVLGRAPISVPAATGLCLALVLPWTLAPVLAALGSGTSEYRVGFTLLMRWGLAPVVGVFLILCAGALHRAWREGRLRGADWLDPRLSAFVVSAGLTVLGFGLGAAIRGSNTMVPAHYHASVGAVTVVFMATTWLMLPAFGLSIPTRGLRRAAGWQPPVYGLGMLLFASGFGLAGSYGMGRKMYGTEQAARGLGETLGLGLMGIGGFVAVAGGLLFLGVVVATAWHGTRTRTTTELSRSSWRWRYGD